MGCNTGGDWRFYMGRNVFIQKSTSEMIHCVNANASTGEAITENSIPNLDDWGWDDYWKIDDWIEWHKIMKEKNGLDAANTKFLTYWNKQSTGANPIDARSFDSNFRDYARKNKFFDNLFSGVGWIKPIGAATDVISSGSDVVSNIG